MILTPTVFKIQRMNFFLTCVALVDHFKNLKRRESECATAKESPSNTSINKYDTVQ